MTNEQAYQELVNSIHGGKVIAVGANPGIGALTFSTQLAVEVAEKQGMKIWFQTKNSFLTKALKNHFNEDKMTVTHRIASAFFAGVRIIDFLIFGNCKPRTLIRSMKIVTKYNNTPTICCIPLKQRRFHHRPRLSDLRLNREQKYVDISILLHREPYTSDGNGNYSTKVTVINKGNQTYTFDMVLTPDGICFPEDKAKKDVD